MNVRDQYCRSITSTALGFKDRPPAPAPAAPLVVVEEKPMTSEIAVDTSDIPYDPPPPVESVQVVEQKVSTEAPTTSKPKTPQPQEESGSGDVLAIFLGMIFKSIWNLIYWVLIGLPLSIVRSSIVSVFVIVILSMVYLHLLEYHHNGHALSLVATTGYHSNAAIGIL